MDKRRRAAQVVKGHDVVVTLDSFDMVRYEHRPSMDGIPHSYSDDSDMAQYSRRRKKKGEKSNKALQLSGFGLFQQCLNSGISDTENVFTEIVQKTKSILLPVLRNNSGATHQHDHFEETDPGTGVDENVEIGEEEILRHDYDLERV